MSGSVRGRSAVPGDPGPHGPHGKQRHRDRPTPDTTGVCFAEGLSAPEPILIHWGPGHTGTKRQSRPRASLQKRVVTQKERDPRRKGRRAVGNGWTGLFVRNRPRRPHRANRDAVERRPIEPGGPWGIHLIPGRRAAARHGGAGNGLPCLLRVDVRTRRGVPGRTAVMQTHVLLRPALLHACTRVLDQGADAHAEQGERRHHRYNPERPSMPHVTRFVTQKDDQPYRSTGRRVSLRPNCYAS